MPEPLKNAYNEAYILTLISSFTTICETFDSKLFHQLIFDENWDDRELKDRMDHIARMIHQVLNVDYVQALSILKPVCQDFGGYEAMFFPHYVELYGMEHWAESIDALEHMTQYSSSEFAVRPFIIKAPKKMMKQMLRWTKHKSHHVRRLSSEGCRPRLPWAMALPEFKQDPELILPILERLKNDESEYVRRSVANNINDIAKDNVSIVKDIAGQWLGGSEHTDWIVKHGCRTLLKQADSDILKLFGYTPVKSLRISDFTLKKSTIEIGSELNFSFSLNCKGENLGKLRIEYAIDYMKSNGKQSRKIFKISEGDVFGNEKILSRKQSFKEMSTRKHYAGEHCISIIVNGVDLGGVGFLVKP
ncbi:DNA alkylation repair protein [Gammaproteobacteria bacterium 45_16_T64]|nr:DNA alkylation repair protein [Gammaproteobacteria bacterium 45_16_T64]